MPRIARRRFANLRSFLEFWVDARNQHTCCLSSTDEEIASEPGQFDCDTCPVADALEDLWSENAEAWRLFNQMATRFTADLHLGGEVFRRLTAEVVDAEDLGDLLDRLSLIYELLYPPPPMPATT
jgi:hypothetical protein